MKQRHIAPTGLLLTLSIIGQAQTPPPPHHKHHFPRTHPAHPVPPPLSPLGNQRSPVKIQVDADPNHAVNRFNPVFTLGAGVDSQNAGTDALIYSRSNIAAMLTAEAFPLTYRLYTELSVQAWHWNPQGAWSDPNGQGYFTGDADGDGSILVSGQFALPHRGFTTDQGNNSDYSRLTDGDGATYWKSNPYLSSAYTGEDDSLHPQWVLVDLGRKQGVNAIQLQWANPYAVDFEVQYWQGGSPIDDPANGDWVAFPQGSFSGQPGGVQTLLLAAKPLSVQYLRVLMKSSSGTYDTHGASDLRNAQGYALFEIGVGKLDSKHRFHDRVRHRKDQSQTLTYVSSVDPWHTPGDLVPDQEQPGLDLVFRSGLTRGLPAVVPVSMLYGTPEDAAAEIRYLEAHHYNIGYVELGEEPDGQYVTPEDDAALYIQWARALHSVDPLLKLGGPVFSGDSIPWWPDASGNTDWLNRFVGYLNSHGRLSDLSFVSVEHYPFPPGSVSWDQVRQEPANVDSIFQMMKTSGLPDGFPLFITEYNFSYGVALTPHIAAAAWQADFVGRFLSGGSGARGAYFYQYEPLPLVSDAPGVWGTFSMFTADGDYQIKKPIAQYFSNRLINTVWALPSINPLDLCTVYPASGDLIDGQGAAIVTVYALQRPDGQWALLLINKDPKNSQKAAISFNTGSTSQSFTGTVDLYTFNADDYVWHPNGVNGYPLPDGPYKHRQATAGPGVFFTLPRGSITVLRGNVP